MWSVRLCPTLELSRSGSIPISLSSPALPMPECMRMRGEPIVPPHNMTSLEALKLTGLDISE